MRIARNVQKEGEKRPVFLWLPVWNEDEILWLETVNHYWLTNPIGMVSNFYERITQPIRHKRMTQTNEERVEENLDKPDSISIRIDEAYNKGVADTLARVREETIEECAVTIWQAWGSNDFPLEDSERSRTFSEAIKVVRALRALTPPSLESDKTEV